ncbi:hypothetical protein M514_04767 [Trichuris suis]|uniref:Uncharacterized protein n=1 Tax=Trichuris suis TaxID=68888 RepID=A0A085MUA4_9BILA|nr:hypothetical protein M514_04767 [Trichuris suis]
MMNYGERRVLKAVGMSTGPSPSSDKAPYDKSDLPTGRTDANEQIHHADPNVCLDGSENYDCSLPNLSEKVNDEDDKCPSKEEAVVEPEECVPSCSSPPATCSEHIESALNADVSEETTCTISEKPKRVSPTESANKLKRVNNRGEIGKKAKHLQVQQLRRSQRIKLHRLLAKERKAEIENRQAEAANFCYVCKLECSANLCVRCKRCGMLAHWDPMFCCLRYCLLSNGSSFFCPKCAGINSLTNSEAPVEDYREPFIPRSKCITCGSSLRTSAGQFGRTVYCSPDCINHLCDAAKKQSDDYKVERVPMVEPFVYGTSVHGSNAPNRRRLFSWIVNHPTFRPVFWLKSLEPAAVSTSTVHSSQSDTNEQCSSRGSVDADLPASTNIGRCFACFKTITSDEDVFACKNCNILLHENNSAWSCARFCLYNEYFVCPRCNTMTKLMDDCSSGLFKVQLTCTHCAYCGKPLASDLRGVSALCGSSCVDLTIDAIRNIIRKTHRRLIPMIEPFPGGKIVPAGSDAPRFSDLAMFMQENPTLFPVLLLRTCNAQWTIASSSANTLELISGSGDAPSKDKETTTILSKAKKSLTHIEKRSAAKRAKNGKPRNWQPKKSRSTFRAGQNCGRTSPSINNCNETVTSAEVVHSVGTPPIVSDNDKTYELRTKNSNNNETDVSSEVPNCIDALPVIADDEQTSEMDKKNSDESVVSAEVVSCVPTLPVIGDNEQTSEMGIKNSDESVVSPKIVSCIATLPVIANNEQTPEMGIKNSNQSVVSAELVSCITTLRVIADNEQTSELNRKNPNGSVVSAEVVSCIATLRIITDNEQTSKVMETKGSGNNNDTVTSTEVANCTHVLPVIPDNSDQLSDVCTKEDSTSNHNETIVSEEDANCIDATLPVIADSDRTTELEGENSSDNNDTVTSVEVADCAHVLPVIPDNNDQLSDVPTKEDSTSNYNETIVSEEDANCVDTLPVIEDNDQTTELEGKNSDDNNETVTLAEVANSVEVLPVVADDDQTFEQAKCPSNDTVTSTEFVNSNGTLPATADSNEACELQSKTSDNNANETVVSAQVENSIGSSDLMVDHVPTEEPLSACGEDNEMKLDEPSIISKAAAEDDATAVSIDDNTEPSAVEDGRFSQLTNSSSVPSSVDNDNLRKRNKEPSPRRAKKARDSVGLIEETNECASSDPSRKKQKNKKKKKKKKIAYSSSASEASLEVHPRRRVLPPKAKITATREKQRQEKRRSLRREENAAAKTRPPDAANGRQGSCANNLPKNMLNKPSKPSSSTRHLGVSSAGSRTQLASERKTRKATRRETATTSAVISPALAIIEEFERKQADAIKAKQEAQTVEGADTEQTRDSNGYLANTCPNTPSTSTGDESVHSKRRRPSRWDVGDPSCRGSPNTVLWRGWVKFACSAPLRMALVPVLGMAIPVCKWLPETLDFTHACRKGPLLESYLQGCVDSCIPNIVVARFKEPLSTEQPRYRRRFQRLKEIDYYPFAIVREGPPWFNICAVALDAEDALPACLRNLPGPGLPYLRRNAILLYMVFIDQSGMVHRPIFVFPDESYVNQSCTGATGSHGAPNRQETASRSGSLTPYSQGITTMSDHHPEAISAATIPGAGNQFRYPPPFSLPQPVERPSGYVSPMQRHCVPSTPPRPAQSVSAVDASLPQPPLGASYSVQPMPVGPRIPPAYGANAMPVSLVPPYPPPPLLFPPRTPNSTFFIPRKPY